VREYITDLFDTFDVLGHGRGLHKTFATAHELPMDDVIGYEMPSCNEVVSDWLKAEMRSNCSESSKGD